MIASYSVLMSGECLSGTTLTIRRSLVVNLSTTTAW